MQIPPGEKEVKNKDAAQDPTQSKNLSAAAIAKMTQVRSAMTNDKASTPWTPPWPVTETSRHEPNTAEEDPIKWRSKRFSLASATRLAKRQPHRKMLRTAPMASRQRQPTLATPL